MSWFTQFKVNLMFYKYGKTEFDKAKDAVGKHKVSDEDVIKTYTVTYVDPSSKVQHGMKIVYDETTGQVLYQKGWGGDGEYEANLKKYGAGFLTNYIKTYIQKNPDVKQFQDDVRGQSNFGTGVQKIADAIVRAKGINSSKKSTVDISSGKDYNQSLITAEEKKRQLAEKRKKDELLKDWQDMSRGPIKNWDTN